jgi:hypothetical protein
VVKAPSPLLGFNNNVRHKGRVFHIQTEDSGIRHPHIITHLFADGGRILKSTKTSYAEHLGRPGMAETVRGMMQEQHKAMFIALRDGQYDYLFDESASHPGAPTTSPSQKQAAAPVTPPVATPPAEAPPAAAPPAEAPPAAALPEEPPPAAAPPVEPQPAAAPVAATPSATVPPATAPSAKTPSVPPIAVIPEAAGYRPSALDQARRGPTTGAEPTLSAVAPPPTPLPPEDTTDPASRRRTTPRPKLQINTEALHARESGLSAPQVTLPHDLPPPRPQHKSGIDLDLEALERAAVEAQTPFFQQINDLPPPPAAVLGKKPGGTSSSGTFAATTIGSPPMADPANAPRPPGSPIRSPLPPAPAPPATGGTGRYAPSRPAAIFANSHPQQGTSIFGEDLISEKSLDEVILSYLAEDLEGPGDKK